MEVCCLNCKQTVEMQILRGRRLCPSCHALDPETCLPPETVVGGFEIVKYIGSGGMGVVYLANQRNLDRPVALKVLKESLSSDPEFVARFFREARSAAALTHPNIVQGYDTGMDNGVYYFAMELVNGKTYDQILEERGRLNELEVKTLALKIAGALDYAFERQSLSHGDIKPENLIQDAVTGVKLSDLGLAKSAREASAEVPDCPMVTPLYAPPEMASGEVREANLLSDIYSFGATLYHMLSGSPMYPDSDPYRAAQHHLQGGYKPLTEWGVSASFSTFADVLLKLKPSERPSSWKKVIELLESVEPASGSKAAQTVKAAHPKKILYVAAGGFLVLLGVLTPILFSAGDKAAVPSAEKKTDVVAAELQARLKAEAEKAALTLKADESERQRRLAQEANRESETAEKTFAGYEYLDFRSFDNRKLTDHLRTLEELERKVADLKPFPAERRFALSALTGKVRAILVEREYLRITETDSLIAAQKTAAENELKRLWHASPETGALDMILETDRLYVLISEVMELPKQERLKQIKTLIETYAQGGTAAVCSNEYFKRLKEVVCEPDPVQGVMVQNFGVLKEAPVKGGDLPKTLSGFVYDGISADGRVRFSQRSGGASVMKLFSWKELGFNGIADMLHTFIERMNWNELSPADRSSLIAYGCLYARGDVRETLRRIIVSKDAVSAGLLELFGDISAVKVYRDYETGVHAFREKRYFTAQEILSRAIAVDSWVRMRNLYRPEAEKMILYCRPFTAAGALECFEPQWKNEPQSSMTAYARFGSLEGISELKRGELEQRYRSMLSSFCRAQKGGKHLDIRRLPFLNMTASAPESWRYLEHLKKETRFCEGFPALDFAGLDAGNAKNHLAFETVLAALPNLNSSPELTLSALAGGAFSARLKSVERMNIYLNELQKRAHSFKKAPQSQTLYSVSAAALNTFLLTQGEFKTLERSAKELLMSVEDPEQLRLALVSLLASQQLTHDCAGQIGNIIWHLRNVKPAPPDIQWLEMVKVPYEKPVWIVDENVCQRLSLIPLQAPDLSVRLMCGSLAVQFDGRRSAILWNRLFEVLEAKIPDHIGAADAWGDLAALRLAMAVKKGYFHTELRALRSVPGIKTLPHQPKLLLWELALRVHDQTLNAEDAVRVFQAQTPSEWMPLWGNEVASLFSGLSDFQCPDADTAEALGVAAALLKGEHEFIRKREGELSKQLTCPRKLLLKTVIQDWK